jgi:hypothetical protein
MKITVGLRTRPSVLVPFPLRSACGEGSSYRHQR